MEDLFERIRHYASLLTHTTTEQQVAFGPVVAWSHITQSGGFMTYHDHGGSWDQPLSILSAVFYIATGDSTSPDIGGSVSLLDRSLKREIRSYPHPGLLIIFPDYVAHGVHTYHGSHDRIIIGVNVEPVPSQD